MTNKAQLNKNFQLSEKLAEYLSKNSTYLKLYRNCSYVVFSEEDENLNKKNSVLAKELVKEGKRVIKATHSIKAKLPWKFEPLYA